MKMFGWCHHGVRLSFNIMIIIVCTFYDADAQISGNNAATVEQVLTEIQKGLIEAQTQIRDLGMPPLESVTLTLQTQYSRQLRSGINLLIFTFGQKWEKQRSQQLELTLVPPKPYTPVDVAGGAKLSEHLVHAIVNAAEGVQKARRGKPPLELDRLKAVFSFVVITNRQVGLNFEIVPVSADLKGDLTQKAIQKISVNFKKP